MPLRFAAAAVAALIAAGCTTGAPPPTDSFCEKFRPKDFRDPALRQQNKQNKEADLVNENTRKRDCTGSGGLLPSSERK